MTQIRGSRERKDCNLVSQAILGSKLSNGSSPVKRWWVPAHFFLCLLAYYVEWHMRRALAPILFEDEKLPEDRKRRDPILPAKASESAKLKKPHTKRPMGSRSTALRL